MQTVVEFRKQFWLCFLTAIRYGENSVDRGVGDLGGESPVTAASERLRLPRLP